MMKLIRQGHINTYNNYKHKMDIMNKQRLTMYTVKLAMKVTVKLTVHELTMNKDQLHTN